MPFYAFYFYFYFDAILCYICLNADSTQSLIIIVFSFFLHLAYFLPQIYFQIEATESTELRTKRKKERENRDQTSTNAPNVKAIFNWNMKQRYSIISTTIRESKPIKPKLPQPASGLKSSSDFQQTMIFPVPVSDGYAEKLISKTKKIHWMALIANLLCDSTNIWTVKMSSMSFFFYQIQECPIIVWGQVQKDRIRKR